MGVERLAHVGLYVDDLDAQLAFYRDVIGLQVTDVDLPNGLAFLSSRPDEEHHELLLHAGRNVGRSALVLQQISFRCHRLEDVLEYHRTLVEHGVRIEMTVSHGNAIGVYGFDPEGNRFELYWPTGLQATQPYIQELDLSQPADEILAVVQRGVAEHAAEGFVDVGYLDRVSAAAADNFRD